MAIIDTIHEAQFVDEFRLNKKIFKDLSKQGPSVEPQLLASAKKVGKTYLQNPCAGIDKITPIINSFYIPGHGLKTGQEIVYNIGAGSSGPNVSAWNFFCLN